MFDIKKFFIATCLLFTSVIVSAVETGDTIKVDSTNVIMVESSKGITISLRGSKNDTTFNYKLNVDFPDGTTVNAADESKFNLELPFTKKRNNKGGCQIDFKTGDFLIGFTGGVNVPTDAKVDMGRSFEASALNLFAVELRTGRFTPSFSLGVGLNCKSLTGKNGPMYVKNNNNGIAISKFPEYSYDQKTTIRTTAVCFPITIRQNLGKGWQIKGAASFDVNFSCNVSCKYNLKDEQYSWSWKNAPNNTIGYSFMGAIGYDDLGIFCKFTPTPIFKDGFGPKFSTLSVGIIVL